jgi:hypothetical protein
MSVTAKMARKNHHRKHFKTHHLHKQHKTQVPVPMLIKHTTKQVHFPDDDGDLVKVVEFDDDVESQKMRECYWEIFARDRARFRDRIQQSEEILNAILEPKHREKVYQEWNQGACTESPA